MRALGGAARLMLLELRPRGVLSAAVFALNSLYRAVGPRLSARVAPGVQTQLTQTLVPYTTILEQNKWVAWAIDREAKAQGGGDKEKPAGVV